MSIINFSWILLYIKRNCHNIRKIGGEREKMRRMKIWLAVVFSALVVGLLLTGSVASDDMAGENATVNLTGSWIYEYQLDFRR